VQDHDESTGKKEDVRIQEDNEVRIHEENEKNVRVQEEEKKENDESTYEKEY